MEESSRVSTNLMEESLQANRNVVEGRLIAQRKRRERRQAYKELAAKSCYSVIIVIVALVALRPLLVDQILSRADAYSALGQIDESQRQCDKALLIDDNSSRAWCQLARIRKTTGDRSGAYEAYDRAVQADAANRSANFELGMLYADDDRHQLAIPYFEQVRGLGPDPLVPGQPGPTSYHRDALHMLELCYKKVGNAVKTELILKEIRAFYPNSTSTSDPSKPLPVDGLPH
jgi:tetratricopeptide (TPR) repeat protein